MTLDHWSTVDSYIGTTLVDEHDEPALAAAMADIVAAGLPSISVTPPMGRLLMILAKAIGARRVLEVGTLGGYSAIWFTMALPTDGRLVTLECDERHATVARANIARARNAGVVDLRLGRALETLPLLADERGEPFDLVFIDADKPSNPEYFAWALRLTRPGGLVIVDNVVRGGAVADAESADPSVQGVRRMHEMIANDDRVVATALQTVGGKGWDGFTVAMVRG